MPPDGACILTVLKPLQSLTGGSRLETSAKTAPHNPPINQRRQIPIGRNDRANREIWRYLIRVFIFTPFLIYRVVRIRFFASARANLASGSTNDCDGE